MTSNRPRVSLAWATAVAIPLVLAIASPALAEPNLSQCIAANERSIQLRSSHALRQSREQSLVCAAATCPRAVRDVCQKRVTELTTAIPTIVFEVKDAGGRDVTAVKVSMDRQPLVDHLDGSPVPIDPGEHTFTFDAPGLGPLEKHIVVYEGEHDRRERVAPAPAAPVAGGTTGEAPAGATADGTSPASPGLATQRALGIALGGVGIVGVGVGSVFGLLTMSSWSKAKNACGPGGTSHCVTGDPAAVTSDKNTAQTDGTISTIAFVAGGLLVAGGAALFFMGGHSEGNTTTPAASLGVAPAVGPGIAGLSLQGAF